MLCPICNNKLTEQQKGLLICLDGHGTLITGKYLSDIKVKSAPKEQPYSHSNSQQIICPHCKAQMQKVDYNNTNIVIDACTNCHYRWLDSGEVTKIKNYKPDISAQDLLFIANVDEQTKIASQKKTKEANPRLPLQGSWRVTTGSANLSGNNHIRLGAIIGQGLYGIIKGLTHSKTSRTLTLITLLIFGLLFYFIAILNL